jgi:endonuclease G, mitochondrial
MKKTNILLTLILIINVSFAQTNHDTLIKTAIYKSLYSKDYNMPRMVSYKLYKAGGECSRADEGMTFHIDNVKLNISGKDYAKSGYDIGHMANAEDFSYNCTIEELTFRFYNAVPQSPKSNRGIWKHYETETRKLSQTDSVFVMCGPIIDKDTKKLGTTRLFIPTHTWKVVYSLTSKKLIYCLIFDNDNVTAKVNQITLDELQKLTGLNLLLK